MIRLEVSTRLGFLHSFGRSSALGSIVVAGLGMLRIFVSFIFFLQLCRYHPFCHYFCGARGDEFFINQGASKLFIGFCFVLLKSGSWFLFLFFVFPLISARRVLILRWSI